MPPWVDPNTHGWLHTPRDNRAWVALLRRYGAAPDDPLARVFEVARANRCLSVVEENRYVDPDYRSEYSAFWSHRFPTRPAFARRLHFFRRRLATDRLHRIRQSDGYIGYSVLKPVGQGRVGRTMLVPPPRLSRATLAVATDHVSLYGAPLAVTGFPFCQQDAEYLRCAHVAAWMCHYYAYLRGLTGRRITAELVQTVPPAVDQPERALPSPGLTLNQIQALFGATGQPALFYGASKMPEVEGVDNPIPRRDAKGRILAPGLWDTRIFSVVCRYLNAGFPVLIGTEDHAIVAIGWYRERGRIRFVISDDQWGPYQVIPSPFTYAKGPWWSFMVPLPPKTYLSGEMAESTAHLLIRAYGAIQGAPAAWADLAQKLTTRDVSLRTFLRSNVDYKSAVARQGRGDEVTRILRLARLPHWIWVVEAHNRALRDRNRRSVLAEFLFDSTSWDKRPRLDALSLPALTTVYPPDNGRIERVAGPTRPWASHLPPR